MIFRKLVTLLLFAFAAQSAQAQMVWLESESRQSREHGVEIVSGLLSAAAMDRETELDRVWY